MSKKLIFLAVLVLMTSGCVTTRRDQGMTTQLQMRVGELEREIQTRNQRINELESEVKDLAYDVKKLEANTASTRTSSRKTSTSVKDDERIIRVDVKATDVQTALKNAGYYSAAIDGNVGSGTKKAIYEFQKDKGIKADGLIGRETWSQLKVYLN